MEKIIQAQVELAHSNMDDAVDNADYALALYWQTRIEALEDVLTEIEALEHKPVHLEVVK